MTPDAVIFRYIQLITPRINQREDLARLIASDADLLRGWLQALQLPASTNALKEKLAALTEEQLLGFSRAQLGLLAPNSGSARLSLEQWALVLKAAFLAEALFLECCHTDQRQFADEVSMRALLALSGVQLDQDPRLTELIEYRGANPSLLEDSELELRIFAVIDGLELGREFELAEQLLEVSEEQLNQMLQSATRGVTEYTASLNIQLDDERDWQEKIWIYQQIELVRSAYVTQANSKHDVITAHETISRSLFRKPPTLLSLSHENKLITHVDPRVSISLDNQASPIAAASRSHTNTRVENTGQLAIVDRQIMRGLDADQVYVAVAGHEDHLVTLIADLDEDLDVELALGLYATVIADHLQSIQPAVDEADGALEMFRTLESKRLREIVHEANNPLSIVHNYLHILELRLQHDAGVAEQLNLIGSELRRAAEVFATARDVPEGLTEDLVTPQEESVSEAADLAQWLPGCVELHQGMAHAEGVSLGVSLPEDGEVLMPLAINWDGLSQILTNLLKNAVEACSQGDSIQVMAFDGVYRSGRPG